MVEQAGSPAYEAESSLADSRAQFVGSLGRRLEALRQALVALEQSPRSSTHRDHLRRRIHAFGAAAGVLGFERVFEAFREAEVILGSTGPTALGSAEFGLVARTLDLVPSLVLGATHSSRPPALERRSSGYPTSVLVFGAAPLAEALVAAASSVGAALECERTEDASRAEEIVRVTAPDVAVIDADRAGARELMEVLAYDPLLDPVRVIAVGTFDRPEAAAALVTLGVVRVLPKPVSPESLKRSVLEVAGERGASPERVEPIGDVTVEALAERLATELRRGLVEALKPQGRGVTVALGDGTDVLAAAWSSVARIRELVTLRSGGAVRFDSSGPEGAIPLAPWMASDDRPRTSGLGERRTSEGVSLEGRTLVVADDDPSVVWFLSGLFRAAGAQVLEAHDGRRALELVRRAWPDVVISDILMPELDGFALCREIKRDVALSDVPVVLLSWKEDLLQRVRELGADADGYLRKEATASTVVQRVKEVLLPRARVEARVAAGALARGRLDGLTPRLVLDVLCRHGQNSHLTVRDAAFLYEVDVRGGRVRAATRTASDGRAETGERALSTLLGVRAGRFAVRRDASACPEDWDLELKDLLDGPIERARAARSLLSDPRRVARVEMDVLALEPYLAATPGSVRDVAERLSDGESPENMLHSGVAAPLLESVLVDAVLHGAVQRLVGRNGEDLLAKEIAAEQDRRARFSRDLPKAPLIEVQRLLPDFVPRADEAPDSPLAAIVPGAGEGGPTVAQGADEPAMSPERDDPARPPLDAVLERPPEVILPGPSDALTESAPAVTGFHSSLGPSTPSPAAESFSGEGFETLLVDSSPPPEAPEADRHPSAKPRTYTPILSAPPALSPLESAVLSVAAPTSARSRFTSSVPPPSSQDSKAAPLFDPGLPASFELKIEGEAALDLGTAVAALGDAGDGRAPEAPPASSSEDAGAGAAPAAEASPAGVAASEPSLPAAAEPAPESGQGPAVTGEAADPVETPRDGVRAEEFARASVRAGLEEPTSSVVVAGSEEPIVLGARKEVGSRAGTASAALAATDSATATPRGDAAATPASAVVFATQKSSEPPAAKADDRKHETTQQTRKVLRAPLKNTGTQRSAPAPDDGGPGGILGIVAVVCVAAVSSFTIVRAIRGAPDAPLDPAPPLAVSAPAPAPSASAPPAPPTITVTDLDLPAGLAVDADRGLLEIEIDAAQNLYVDGVLIGPGPFRQVPLREGLHTIRIQGAGADLSRPVEIRKGRRVRIGLTR